MVKLPNLYRLLLNISKISLNFTEGKVYVSKQLKLQIELKFCYAGYCFQRNKKWFIICTIPYISVHVLLCWQQNLYVITLFIKFLEKRLRIRDYTLLNENQHGFL